MLSVPCDISGFELHSSPLAAKLVSNEVILWAYFSEANDLARDLEMSQRRSPGGNV